ncbi:MAG: hypothetical protein AB1700_20490, partial [Bacillota bacterium]
MPYGLEGTIIMAPNTFGKKKWKGVHRDGTAVPIRTSSESNHFLADVPVFEIAPDLARRKIFDLVGDIYDPDAVGREAQSIGHCKAVVILR